MKEVPQRHEIADTLKWDTESVYTSPTAWEEDFARLDTLVAPIRDARGKLDSAAALAALFRAEDALGLVIDRLHLYAHMKEDEDTSVGVNQDRMARLRASLARIAGDTAWVDPEVLALPEETLRAWMEDAALAPYRRSLELLLRRKPHTLTAAEETLLGLAGDVLGVPYETFSKLTNADMKFDPAKDAAGNEHAVSNGSLGPLLQSPDRTLRRAAFESLYKGYGEHINTLNTLLSGSTKSHVFNARVRRHASALEASLFGDNIPKTVYTSLIAAVRGALPVFHRYVDLRARALNLVGDLNMWDFHVPMVPNLKMEIGWEQCREWIEASLSALGADYMKGVRASFDERWYDVYENKGKRSGAYSTGAYGQKPFMLLNYHGTLNDVFTVAHELGHSMHTFLSNANQPYRTAGYPIFLAEIASTTNEALLHHHLMTTQQDRKVRAYLLNHLCDSFRGTMFRQTMFAEFEMWIHERLEKGEAMTPDTLKAYYRQLNADYHGPAVTADDRIAIEWARIPHFYYNFYVYKYATGFAAAQIFARQVLSGDAGRERYLGFLRSGSSRDPLDTVRTAGVDLADPAVLQRCFTEFDSAISELAQLLDLV
jgi:oligoendopeptidase F